MRPLSLPIVLLAACGDPAGWAPPPPGDAEPAFPIAPPPGQAALSVSPRRVAPGDPLVVEVTGLTPGATLRLYGAARAEPGGPCAPTAPDVCLSLHRPAQVLSGVADAAGRFRRTVTLPSTMGGTRFLQAVEVGAGAQVTGIRWIAVQTPDDTDGDGLSDQRETRLGTFVLRPDSDFDGVPDGAEQGVGLDPLDPDSDGDGLTDGEELLVHGTNPTRHDTDGDGLSDRAELTYGLTDPRDPDMDGDHLPDGAEVDLGTDPLDPDADADGRPDGEDPWPFDPQPPDPFVPVVAPATPSHVSIPDAELDPVTGRITWQDLAGDEVWVAEIDPLSGSVRPPNGRGQLIDVDVAPISLGKNGPEWALGGAGPYVLYSRLDGPDPTVHRAQEVFGRWRTLQIPGSEGERAPFGAMDPADPDPVYRAVVGDVTSPHLQVVWREIENPSVSGVAPVALLSAKWLPQEDAFVGLMLPPGEDRQQVGLYDLASGTVTQLTSGPTYKDTPFVWRAPELGGERVLVVTRGPERRVQTELVLHREDGGAWSELAVIPAPPAWPYVLSPEPFVWNGRSYISFLASREADTADNAEATVWFVSLDDNPLVLRRVSPADGQERKDPEPFLVPGAQPRIYWADLDGRQRWLHHGATGL